MDENQVEDIQPEITEEVAPEVEVTEEPPVIQAPDADALSRELDDAKNALQRKSMEFDFFRKASEKGLGNIDKVMPFIDFSKVSTEEGVDTIGEIIDILSQSAPQQKKRQAPLGEASNGGQQPEKSSEVLLKQAGEKAKKSGKLEDIAAFSALKTKLFGGGR